MSDTVNLDLSALLPDVPDAKDGCVHLLAKEIRALPGVERVHVKDSEGHEPARLCVHYQPREVTLDDIRGAASREGIRLTNEIGHLLWGVDGLSDARRARTVGERLRRLDGVLDAEATAAGVVRVEFDRRRASEATIEAALGGLGLRAQEAPHVAPTVVAVGASPSREELGPRHGPGAARAHAHGRHLGERAELAFAAAAGLAYLCGLLVGWLTDLPDTASIAFFALAYVLGGFFTVREAVDSIRAGRFEVDFLMLVAAAGAAVLGKWAEGAVLLFLFSLGHALEHFAMGRARRAIEALAKLAPATALVRRDGIEREMPVESVAIGDIIVVRPHDRLPADGVVVLGSSAVDQAPITGESIPVEKHPPDDIARALADPEALDLASRVFAGSINGPGVLEVSVTRRADDNTLARVVRMVQEAETHRSPSQRFTDRFERIFVPAVLGLVTLLLFAGVVVDEPFADSLYRALAVLVAASPCALAIATPSAVLSAIARAANRGVLVKGGGPLENLGALRAMAFDKTGTLTRGRPRLTDVVVVEGASEGELLATAVAVERLSDHPLAAAVVRDGTRRLGEEAVPAASDLRGIVGRGVEAVVEGDAVRIGSLALFEGGVAEPPLAVRGAVEAMAEQGRTTMTVRRGGRFLGVLGMMDTPRESARGVIAQLHALGVRRTIMLSGDDQRVAEAVAEDVGIDEAWGQLMPEDKVAAVRRLADEEGRTAMVGDGVNDAPAMANATVGIAMGAAGSDVALETADVALMADDLTQLPFATGLSRRASATIKQNLVISLGIVGLLIPATVLGLGVGPAVLVHEGSTLVVVLNALRLLGYRAPA